MDNNFKKTWRIISPILIYLIIERVVGFCINFYYIMGRLDETTVWSEELKNQLYLEVYDMLSQNTVLISGIVSAISIFIFYRMVSKEWQKRGALAKSAQLSMKTYLFTGMISVGFTIGVNLVINAYGIFKYNYDFAQVSQMIYSEPIYLQLLVIGLLVPVCEELLFRGVVYERISQNGSPKAAWLLTSVLFAFFHGTWIQIIYAFFFSFLIIYTYQQSGSFKMPLLFHIVSNLSALILRQLPVLSTMGYSVGIVLFTLIGVFGLYGIKKNSVPCENGQQA